MNNFVRATLLTVLGAATTTVTYFAKEYAPEKNRQKRIEWAVQKQDKSVDDLDNAHVAFLEAQDDLREDLRAGGANEKAKVKALHKADSIYSAHLNMLDERDRLVYFDQIIVPPPSLEAPSIFMKSLSPDGLKLSAPALSGEGTALFMEHATVQDRMDHKKDELFNAAFWGAAIGLVTFALFGRKKKSESKNKMGKKPEESKTEETMRHEGVNITVPQADKQNRILSGAPEMKQVSGHDDPKQLKGSDEPKQLPGHSPKRLNP